MYKVLLVEDEVLVREAITENIAWNEIGLQLMATCKNGKEAIKVIEKEVPDIVITDICMPYVNGMQLSKYIYEKYPETKIIIFSGYDEFGYAKEALQYRVEEYLLKPVTAIQLTELLINIKEKIDSERKVRDDMKKIRGTYHKYLSTIRAEMLNDLLLGDKTEEEYRDEIKESGLELNKKYFKVAVIDIEKSQLSELITGDNQKQSALLSFATYNIINEIMITKPIGIAFQQKDKRNVIIFQSNLKQEFENEVKTVCTLIQDKIKDYLHMNTVIGIGKKVETLSNIYLSYEGAYESTQYSYLLGDNCIISQEEILTLKKEIDLSANVEALLLQVKKQSYQGVQLETDQLLQAIKKAYLRKEEVLIIMQNIMVGSNEILKLVGIEKMAKEYKHEKWIYEFEEKENINEAFEVINTYLDFIMKQVYKLREDTGKKQSLLALDYIEKNYQNSEITLQTLCKYLSISPSYFSAVFKKETGETFVEVLTKKRMDVAKNLLQYTALKNYEIAEKVGFSDSHYFSQTFKKFVGKTPKEYAKESREAL